MKKMFIAIRYLVIITFVIFDLSAQAEQLTINSIIGSGGTVQLDWASSSSEEAYKIYVSKNDFTEVASLQPVKAVDGVASTKISGLEVDTQYYFAVVSGDHADGVVSTQAHLITTDSVGPEIKSVKLNGSLLSSTSNLRSGDSITISMTDDSGVAMGSLIVGNSIIPLSIGYQSATANISSLGNESIASIEIKLEDSLGNVSNSQFSIMGVLFDNVSASILSPLNGDIKNKRIVEVRAEAEGADLYRFLINGTPTNNWKSINGNIRDQLNLIAANNVLQLEVKSYNSTNTFKSSIVNVVLDETIPDAPSAFKVSAGKSGSVSLSWISSSDSEVQIFRTLSSEETESFELIATINDANSYVDFTPTDAEYIYRINTLKNGQESSFSPTLKVMSDSKGPELISLEFVGDNKRGDIYGKGLVNITAQLSEVPGSIPHLAFSSASMPPVNVALTQVEGESLIYTGRFEIAPNTFSTGTVYPIYNARDRYGNKGASVQATAISVDVTAPTLASDISNVILDNSAELAAENKRYSESFSLSDSNSIQNSISAKLVDKITGVELADSILDLTPEQNGQYIYEYQFNSVIGHPPQLFDLIVSASDDFDNSTTSILAGKIQVYQGDIPPPFTPENIALKALPLGEIIANWSAVDGATGYQVLLGSSPNDLSINSTVNATSISLNKPDGNYFIAIKAYREQNGKIAYSPQSEVKSIRSISVAPLSPNNIVLNTQATQVELTWQATAEAITVIKRSQSNDVNSAELLIETGNTSYIDYTPIKNAHYWLATKDIAGNLSAWAHVQELSISVDPVTAVTLTRKEDGYPIIEWEYKAASTFNIYRKMGDDDFVKIKDGHSEKIYRDSSLLIAQSWVRPVSYKVTSVSNTVESEGVEIALSQYEVTGVTGSIRRGVVSVLLAELSNLSELPTEELILETSYVIADTTVKTEQDLTSLAGEQVKPIKLVIPGTDDLPAELSISVKIKQVRNDSINIISEQVMTANVLDDAYELTVNYDQLRRGDISNLDISFKNNGDLPISLRWARKIGSQFIASEDITLVVTDASGNLLDRQSVKLTSGEHLIHKENYVVSDTSPEKQLFISDVPMMVKASWPDDIVIGIEISKVHYSVDQDHSYFIKGPTSSIHGTLSNAPYSAIISSITPATIYADGQSEAVIQGRVISEANISLKPIEIVVNIKGFERKLTAFSDDLGNFNAIYKPAKGETGIHKISVIYPGLSARPDSSFINVIGAGVSPEALNVVMGRNFKKEISLKVTASETTALTNVIAVLEGESGLYLEVEGIPYIAPGETSILKLNIASSTLGSGNLNLRVKADEFEHAIGYTSIQYVVADSQPVITSTPAFINSGVKTEQITRDTIQVKNTGLVDLLNAKIKLQMLNDGAWLDAPSWINIESGRIIDRLAVGNEHTITLLASPSALDAVADYRFRAFISADNMQSTAIDIFHKITSSAEGSVYFSISDNYTGTEDASGNVYGGVTNSSIKIQNADALSETYDQVTDSEGFSTFSNIPAGNYYYEVTAFDHQKITGQFEIKPGITNTMNLLIPVNTVKVNFEVIETSITDTYKVELNNTFETDVPAAIVAFEPSRVEIPLMKKGEVFTEELTMTNHGLLKAYGLKPNLPESTEYTRFEFLGEFPSTLDPGESVSIPYKVVALKDFDDYAEGAATGAGKVKWLDVGDINVSGFYYCNAGVIIFVAPSCLFVVSQGFNFFLGGSIKVTGIDMGEPTTIGLNPDGSVTSSNETISVTIRGHNSPSSSSSGPDTSGTTSNLADAISNNNPSGTGTSGTGSTNQPVSQPHYSGDVYSIKIDKNNTLRGCRKMTNAGISIAVGSAFAGCE